MSCWVDRDVWPEPSADVLAAIEKDHIRLFRLDIDAGPVLYRPATRAEWTMITSRLAKHGAQPEMLIRIQEEITRMQVVYPPLAVLDKELDQAPGLAQTISDACIDATKGVRERAIKK